MDQGVIRQKLTAVPAAQAMAEGGAARAWPLALARAARDRLGLGLDCGPVRLDRFSLAELLDLPPDRALIAVLEGPRNAMGVLILSPEVLAAVIEMQTLGKVTQQPLIQRRPTRTDAAMVADYLDAVLIALETALAADADLVWTDGFRYASFLEEARPLALMLEDTAYKVLRCDCDLGGARQGGLVLALPAEGHGRRPERAQAQLTPDPGLRMQFSSDLQAQVLAAEVRVQAVLHRVSLPLSAVLALQPGDLLPLPTAALDRIELAGQDGLKRGLGKLGQHRGMRAIRLLADDQATLPTPALPQSADPAPAPPARLPLTGTG